MPAGIKDTQYFTKESNLIACAATVELCHSHNPKAGFGGINEFIQHTDTPSQWEASGTVAFLHQHLSVSRQARERESKLEMYCVKGDKRITLFVDEIII